jgi:hypothetical protein
MYDPPPPPANGKEGDRKGGGGRAGRAHPPFPGHVIVVKFRARAFTRGGGDGGGEIGGGGDGGGDGAVVKLVT